MDWLLEAFENECFGHADLTRFGVIPCEEVDDKLRFSLIRRPSHYRYAPQMLLASDGSPSCQWDDVMSHLARWLVRHLNDPKLIIWIVDRGGQLHERWQRLIEHELERFSSLERDGKSDELDDIRSKAPNAIPSPLMRTLWRLLLSGRVKSPRHNFDLHRLGLRLKQERLTASMRLELRELLAPKVTLKKPFRWNEDELSLGEATRLQQLVESELVLAADHVYSVLRVDKEHWRAALPHLLGDFQLLLHDALELLSELGQADYHRDRSHWVLPSITPHWQNKGFHDWVALIELLRDAWLAVRANDSKQATRIAQSWFDLPYPTFKRLALFAASQDDCIFPELWVEWLLADGAWWLWSTETRREVYRLFVLQGRHLVGDVQEHLETAILAGPPRRMFRDDLEPESWQDLVAHSIWLHLAKLKSSGLILGSYAEARLTELSTVYPQWKLATNERDEFSHWMSGTGDPDFEESREVDIAPRKRRELVQWLTRSKPKQTLHYEDTWREVCRTRFYHSLCALYDLAKDDVWPDDRWREALQAWSEEGIVLRSWRYAAPLVKAMPDDVFQNIVHAITRWIEAVSKSAACHEEILLDLCCRVMSLPLEFDTGARIIRHGKEIYDPVNSAINHPVGDITQALINLWFQGSPNDNDLLPANVKPLFSKLCDVQVERYRHGRVLLASRLIAFFRVDHQWCEQYLLPIFNWNNPVEAKSVWEGFLWSPRLYQPLLIAFKKDFLECAKHYTELGEHRQQFAAFLTYAALGPTEGYSMEDFRAAIDTLSQDGLEEAAQALSQALESAGGQCEDYWKNRALPFWQQVWPKSRELATPKITESLARLAIAARGEFQAALSTLHNWLQPIEHPYYIIRLLQESGLCRRFPEEALQLLNVIIADLSWGHEKLALCLDEIEQSACHLLQDARYQRLQNMYA